MKIYIVEDNKKILEKVGGHIGEYVCVNDVGCMVKTYNSRFSDILGEIDSDEQNIYFLDIMLGEEMNGLSLAQKIRSIDIHGYIIFITSHMEFAFPAIQYKIRALDYILKSDEALREKVHACLDTAVGELQGQQREKDERTLVVRTGGTHFIIPTEDIIFFETNTHKRSIVLHTKDKTIEFRDSLDDLQERLDDSFYRCHRSFLINTTHVQSISKKRGDMYVTMNHGFTCLLSSRYVRGLLRYERDDL